MKRKILLLVACPIILCLILFYTATKETSSNRNATTFTGNAMTVDYRIVVGQVLTEEQYAVASRVIRETFNTINATYNKWNPDSELSRLNRIKAGIVATISPAMERFLKQIQQLVELSGGRFDPTIEPLQRLWKEKLVQQQKPSARELATLQPAIGWDKIHFGGGLFHKDHDQTSLDLGGIAKGLAVDLLIQRLKAIGYTDLFVEWGGEIGASGMHPDGRPWNVFISRLGNPNPDAAIAHLSLYNQSIATSGNYLQNWTLPSKQETYFHIFDPKSLQPLQVTRSRVASASVLAESCTFADGLATAAMLFETIEEAEAWADAVHKKFPEVRFWLYSREAK